MRLIDADALGIGKASREAFETPEYADGWNAAIEIINAAPTIDAVPVVHGRWIKAVDNDTPMHKCSICGARVVKEAYEYENPNLYCYHCGAKMDLEVDEE